MLLKCWSSMIPSTPVLKHNKPKHHERPQQPSQLFTLNYDNKEPKLLSRLNKTSTLSSVSMETKSCETCFKGLQ